MRQMGMSNRKIEEVLSPYNKGQTQDYQVYRDFINSILKQIEEAAELKYDMF